MSNHFIDKGSFSDTLNFLKSDLLDTYNNQASVLDKLIQTENDVVSAYTGKFCLNNKQYWFEYDDVQNRVNIFNAKSEKGENPDSIIDLLNEDNSIGDWPSIDALEADIQDAMDSTYLMYNAACCAENESGEGIVSRMSANCQSWISNAGTSAKSCYQSMCDAANNSGDNSFAILTWILNQYQSIVGASANSDGSYTFTDDNYHVQGFVGQYALQVVFQAATAVLGTVLSIIGSVVGLTIAMAGQAVGALVGLIPNSSDTYIVENGKMLNNIYAQPLFQGTWNASDVPVELLYEVNHSISHSCTKRYPGFVIYETLLGGKFYVEIFAALDWANFSSPSRYESNNSDYTPQTKYKSTYPYLNKITDLRTNGGYVSTLPELDTLITDYAYMGSIAQDASTAAFADWVNYYGKTFSDDVVSADSVWKYFDRACRSSIALTLFYFFFFAANTHYNNDDTVVYWGLPTPSSYYDWSLLNECAYYAGTGFAAGWNDIVNTNIPHMREKYKDSDVILEFLEGISWFDADHGDYVLFTDGIPGKRIPRFTPPKYSDSARSTTIGLAVLVGVAVIGTIVAKTTLRAALKNKQIKRYADVQRKWNTYMESNSEADFKAYRKSIKKYNRWSWISGTSKLSSVSGWELGDSSSGSISMPTQVGGQSISYDSSNRQNDDEVCAAINRAIKVITG